MQYLNFFNTVSDTTDESDLLGHFFNHTPDLLCVATFEGYFLKINPAVSKLLEYSNEELVNIKISELVYEDDKEVTRLTRDKILQGEPLLNFENRYVTKTGKIVWLSWTSIPFYEKKYVFAIAKDVTKKKELEQQQQLLFNEIAKINKDLEHFARMASHNLRSPVANILSLFDLIDFKEIGGDNNQKIINLIKQSTEKVSTTLEGYINELVKKDTNAKLDIQKLNIPNCLDEVINSVIYLVRKDNAVIEKDFTAFEDVIFNKSYLESILLNLLTNALKYRNPKTAAQITFKTLIKDNRKQLIVSDNGIGFDMDLVKDKIFGLNQTFHGNIDAKGVGLFLVKKHVTDLEGEISVDSQKKKGTTFTITFKSGS